MPYHTEELVSLHWPDGTFQRICIPYGRTEWRIALFGFTPVRFDPDIRMDEPLPVHEIVFRRHPDREHRDIFHFVSGPRCCPSCRVRLGPGHMCRERPPTIRPEVVRDYAEADARTATEVQTLIDYMAERTARLETAVPASLPRETDGLNDWLTRAGELIRETRNVQSEGYVPEWAEKLDKE